MCLLLSVSIYLLRKKLNKKEIALYFVNYFYIKNINEFYLYFVLYIFEKNYLLYYNYIKYNFLHVILELFFLPSNILQVFNLFFAHSV